jgi:transposase
VAEGLKREIVSASLMPGVLVSMVARQYDANTNLVFTWRRPYAEMSNVEAPQLVRVVVTPDPPAVAPPAPQWTSQRLSSRVVTAWRIGSNIKGAALGVVLDALERR